MTLPGFLGTPAGIMITSAFLKASSKFSGPLKLKIKLNKRLIKF